MNGSAEFLRGAERRTGGETSYIIYSIRLSGTVTGDTFSVALTTKCSVEPEPEQVSCWRLFLFSYSGS